MATEQQALSWLGTLLLVPNTVKGSSKSILHVVPQGSLLYSRNKSIQEPNFKNYSQTPKLCNLKH